MVIKTTRLIFSTYACHIQVFRYIMSFSLFVHRTYMVLMCLTFAERVCVERETTVYVLERSPWLYGLQNCVQKNANQILNQTFSCI
jgi:hypothetical protein